MQPRSLFVDDEAEEDAEIFSENDCLRGLLSEEGSIKDEQDVRKICEDYLSTEEEDNGSDLEGFIVADSESISSEEWPQPKRLRLDSRKRFRTDHTECPRCGWGSTARRRWTKTRSVAIDLLPEKPKLFDARKALLQRPAPRPRVKQPEERSAEDRSRAGVLFKGVPSFVPEPESEGYTTVRSDLKGCDIRESFRDASRDSGTIFLPDLWGGEVEIFPFERWREAEIRGDSDEQSCHYVVGSQKLSGRGDMFVLVRETVASEVVPMKFNGATQFLSVKVFNLKVT